ncbi:MAG: hypothetical protein HXS54_02455 [Theionarchaea archaeon]|nr:hypothetical protein [Theionarchaea archaeon]
MKNKKVLHKEKSLNGQFDKIIQEFTEELEKNELRNRIFSLEKVNEELRKKNYRDLIEKERLQKENQQLRGELLELKEQLKSSCTFRESVQSTRHCCEQINDP